MFKNHFENFGKKIFCNKNKKIKVNKYFFDKNIKSKKSYDFSLINKFNIGSNKNFFFQKEKERRSYFKKKSKKFKENMSLDKNKNYLF